MGHERSGAAATRGCWEAARPHGSMTAGTAGPTIVRESAPACLTPTRLSACWDHAAHTSDLDQVRCAGPEPAWRPVACGLLS